MDAVRACQGMGAWQVQGAAGWRRTWPSWGQRDGQGWDFGVRTLLLGQSQRALDLCSLWGGFTCKDVYVRVHIPPDTLSYHLTSL